VQYRVDHVGFAAVALAGALLGNGCASNEGGPADPKSTAIYDVARDEYGKGNLREALAKVREALEADSGNAEAAYLGAIIHLAFCERDPSSSDCQFAEAEKYARKALDSSPDMRDARNTLGVVLVHEKRYDDAIEVLKPLTEDILYGSPEKSWGNLGWAYLEKGMTDQAIDALLRSVAAQPRFCVGNFRLGLAYEKKGETKAARQALTRAVETDNRCARIQEAWEARGRTALKLGATEDARSDLTKCSELGRTTPSGTRCDAQLRQLGPSEAPPSEVPPPVAPPAPSASAPAAAPSGAPAAKSP
jgi:type IV pilus assembly protein PilF